MELPEDYISALTPRMLLHEQPLYLEQWQFGQGVALLAYRLFDPTPDTLPLGRTHPHLAELE